MAVSEATENRILGVPASSWLTHPTVVEGIPPDAVPAGNRVYVHHVRTDETPPEAGTSQHYFRVRIAMWIFAVEPRQVCRIKADLLRAIFAGEAAITSAFGQPLFPSEFVPRDDLSTAGQSAGRLEAYLDVVISHSAP